MPADTGAASAHVSVPAQLGPPAAWQSSAQPPSSQRVAPSRAAAQPHNVVDCASQANRDADAPRQKRARFEPLLDPSGPAAPQPPTASSGPGTATISQVAVHSSAPEPAGDGGIAALLGLSAPALPAPAPPAALPTSAQAFSQSLLETQPLVDANDTQNHRTDANPVAASGEEDAGAAGGAEGAGAAAVDADIMALLGIGSSQPPRQFLPMPDAQLWDASAGHEADAADAPNSDDAQTRMRGAGDATRYNMLPAGGTQRANKHDRSLIDLLYTQPYDDGTQQPQGSQATPPGAAEGAAVGSGALSFEQLLQAQDSQPRDASGPTSKEGTPGPAEGHAPEVGLVRLLRHVRSPSPSPKAPACCGERFVKAGSIFEIRSYVTQAGRWLATRSLRTPHVTPHSRRLCAAAAAAHPRSRATRSPRWRSSCPSGQATWCTPRAAASSRS